MLFLLIFNSFQVSSGLISVCMRVINCAAEKHALHAIDMLACTFQLQKVKKIFKYCIFICIFVFVST